MGGGFFKFFDIFGFIFKAILDFFVGADVEVPIGPITPDLGGGLLQSVLDTVIGVIDDLIDGSEEGQETTNTCPTTTGYLHTGAFASTITQGTHTIVNADNFRDAAGAIISEFNCNTGKILQGDTVSVTGPAETRSYIKADGSEGTSTYYPVSITKCDTNLPGNPGYDANKPCYDCESADPVKNPQIAGQKNSGTPGGIFGTCTRDSEYTICAPKKRKHKGTDLLNAKGQPVYAMFDGVATPLAQTENGKLKGAGYYVAIISQVNGKTVRHVYFHLNKDDRASGFVQQGEIIGYQGDSGNLKNAIEQKLTESHLHIKVQENGKDINPFEYFKTKFDPATGALLTPCQ